MKLDNSSRDHPKDDDSSNQKLIDLRAAAVHTWERERLDVVNNGDKKPCAEDEDSNPAAACPWTLRTRPAGERNAAVHTLERERLDVVNNGDKKPCAEDEDSNPAAACTWTLRTRPAGERNGKVVNLAQCRRKLIDLRATVVHTGERERLYVVNNGDKKPFVEDEDSNPAAACPWTLRTHPAGERNGKVMNLVQLQKSKFSIASPEKILKLISLPLPVPNHPENPRIGPELFRRRLIIHAEPSAVLEAVVHDQNRQQRSKQRRWCDESNCPPSSDRSSELPVLDDISSKPWVERIEKAFPFPAAMEVTPSRFEVFALSSMHAPSRLED
nr:uncharacterized protein LOC109164445 [Ipomoea batatas]